MKRYPLVSIVTPSLNQAGFIRETVESILSQDYPNLEYWVIDGGSKDETVEILKSCGDRIHWISEKDYGQSQAVNKGWRQSKGEILGWVNADDLLMPSAVSHAVNTLSSNGSLGAVYGKTNYIDETGGFIQEYPVRPFDYEILVTDTENFIPQPSVFVHRDILAKAGFLKETFHYVMDYDLWLRIGLTAPMKYIPLEMAALRLHSQSKTISAMPKFANEFARMYQDLFSNPVLPPSLRSRQNEIMHTAYIHSASFCFWGGGTRLALEFLHKSWKMHQFPRRRTFWLLLVFSLLGKIGWNLAQVMHGNPMKLEKGFLIR